MRRAALQALVWALLAGGAAAWGWGGPPAPRFAVVPASSLRDGKGQLGSLEERAAGEGLLNRLFGLDCFSKAVAELAADCRRMEQPQKTRLALHLMNCQLEVQGSDTYPCRPRQTLRECTDALPDRAHAMYVEYLTHADTMCLFIQNQNFERYTENMLNQLAEGSKFAKAQLDALSGDVGRLAGSAAELAGKAEATLGLLREHQELEQESLALAKKARAEAAAYFQTLDAKQQLGLELQESALANQAKLEAGQAATLAQLAQAQAAVGGVFELVEGRAAELAAAAGLQAEMQRKLAGELTGLLDSSKGIRSAVDVVIGYQQRSDSVLMRLLGKSYTLEDAAFYAVGVLAAWAAGISPATAKARLPVVALMGVSLLGERLLVDRLHMWLEVDGQDQLLVNLPLPGWLPAALLPAALTPGAGAAVGATSLLQINLKWAVRRAALAIGAAMLLYAFFTHRDYERESYKLLRQLEEEQRRRHEEYLALIRRQKVELAAMLGGTAGGGSSGEHSPPAAAALHGGRRAGTAAAIAAPQWVEQLGRQQQGAAGQRRLLALPGARGKLASVPEEADDEWEDEPEAGAQHSRQQQQVHMPPPTAAAAGRPAARHAAATPAAKERPKAAGTPAGPRSAMMRRVAAAAPTKSGSRKRGPSEAAEAADGPSGKLRAVGRRRGIHTEETEAAGEDDSVAVGGSGKAAAAGLGGKRARRGSADQAAPGAAATKRARRG